MLPFSATTSRNAADRKSDKGGLLPVNRILVAMVSSLALSSILQTIYGQALPTEPPFPAANAWMTLPVPWTPANDRIAAPVREARDNYFDKLIGEPTRLTAQNCRRAHLSEGSNLEPTKEIPDVPNRAVAIGSFAAYQPVWSASGRSIYTETSFTLGNVFQDLVVTHTPGSSITVILPGGTVQSSGEVISFLTDPRKYFIAPGKTYLLVMSYHLNGGFYMLSKTWDLSSGKAERNFSSSSPPLPSSLEGLSLNQIIAALNKQFGH